MKTITVEAPGKIIVSGEHAVVYGEPALVLAVDRVLTVAATFEPHPSVAAYFSKLLTQFAGKSVVDITNAANAFHAVPFQLTVSSQIPVGCGMGSSAALAVALSTLITLLAEQTVELDIINALAFELEKKSHQNPSGVDNTIITFGNALVYQRTPNGLQKTFVTLPASFDDMLVVNTGKPIESTAEMVGIVRTQLDHPKTHDTTEHLIRSVGDCTRTIIAATSGSTDPETFLTALQKNESLLEQLGVVGPSGQSFARAVLALGGTAKVSGAGGAAESSGIFLVHPHEHAERIIAYLQEQEFDFFPLRIHQGVQYAVTNH